jgi:succinate dehydrogenase/fumarate reductase cytochrome b subunit
MVCNIALLGTLTDKMDFYTEVVLYIDFGFTGLMVLEIWALFRLQGKMQFWKEGWNRFELMSLLLVGIIYAAYPALAIYFHDRLGIRHAGE